MRHQVRGSFVLLALVLSAAAQTAWPPVDSAISNNINPSFSNYVQTTVELSQRPQFTWQALLNGENVVGDYGVAYVNTNNQVTGINVQNGQTAMSTPVAGNLMGGLNMSPSGLVLCAGQVITTVSSSGTVTPFAGKTCFDSVIASYDGTMLYYVNPNPTSSTTGELIWSTPMAISFIEGAVQDEANNLYLGPVGLGGTSVFNDTYYFIKVCGKTGDILIQAELPFDFMTASVSGGQTSLMLDTQDQLLFVSNDSMIVAMDLEYNMVWYYSNPNYDFSQKTIFGNVPALGGYGNDGPFVYFPSQGTLFVLLIETGVYEMEFTFPNCAGYLSVLVTPNDVLYVTDGCGGVHGISDVEEVWSMNVNVSTMTARELSVTAIGGQLMLTGDQQFAAGLGSAVIRSTGHAFIGGDNSFPVTLSAYPVLGSLTDVDFVSVTCQLFGGSGIVGILDAQVNGNAEGGVTCFPATTAITGAINSIGIVYYYADGTYYESPTFQLSVISATDVTPTSGPWEGGNVLTVAGTGFSICSEINVTCEFVFYQIVSQPVTPTIVSNTEMTVVVPHSPTGGGIQPTLAYVQVTINGTSFQSAYISYTWGGTGNLGLLEECPACFYAAVIGGSLVGLCLCVVALCICARMRRAKQRKADETINLLRSDQGPPPAYSTKA